VKVGIALKMTTKMCHTGWPNRLAVYVEYITPYGISETTQRIIYPQNNMFAFLWKFLSSVFVKNKFSYLDKTQYFIANNECGIVSNKNDISKKNKNA